jgi:hypothetical protein
MPDPLDIIERRESGGKNVPNYKYGPGFSASGYYQMINSTWRRWAKAAGVDVSQYPRAIDAPREVQRAVAEHGFKTEGFRPWEATKHLVGQEASYRSGATGAGATPMPPSRPTTTATATAIPTLPENPARGLLADTPVTPVQKVANNFQAAQMAQALEAAQLAAASQAAAAPPPAPEPSAPEPPPPALPADYASLLLPRLKRGLLAADTTGMLGV